MLVEVIWDFDKIDDDVIVGICIDGVVDVFSINLFFEFVMD